MKKLIELKNLTKSFDGQPVLKGISLDIYENEFVTLLGPSGCGKTTILRIIGGFLEADGGEVLFDGKDISGLPPYKREVNTVFQKYALFPHLNVYDNIAFGLKLRKEPKDVIEQKVTRMLQLVGLENLRNRRINQMSGGQQQRVAIARALVNEPEVLLLDEPLGALDLKLRKEMQRELKKIQKEVGITFIFVTHDQEEALTMSDKIVIMKEGEIQQIGTPTDIYNEPVNRYVANFIGESNIIEGVMPCDNKVVFEDRTFDCVDGGFEPNEEVEVVIRPEDLDIVPPMQGKLRGRVKSVLFKGVHYDTMVETRAGTSITVQMTVRDDKASVVREGSECISANDFYLDIDDVMQLTDARIIARADAQAWNPETDEFLSISSIKHAIEPKNGTYPVTFETHSGTSITVNMIVADANRVQNRDNGEEIYAMNFFKSADEIQESMAINHDLITWADASAWVLNDDKDVDVRVSITDVQYDFDPMNVKPGIYKVTFSTKGYEYKVSTTDRTEPGDVVGLSFGPEDLHIMKKG